MTVGCLPPFLERIHWRKEMKKTKLANFLATSIGRWKISRNKEDITQRDVETLKSSKMKYYKLSDDTDDKTDIICYSEAGEPGDTTLLQMFIRGIRCEGWDGNFCFYYDENEGNHATDFLANDKGWFLVFDVFKLADRQVIPIFVSENFKNKVEKELPV